MYSLFLGRKFKIYLRRSRQRDWADFPSLQGRLGWGCYKICQICIWLCGGMLAGAHGHFLLLSDATGQLSVRLLYIRIAAVSGPQIQLPLHAELPA